MKHLPSALVAAVMALSLPAAADDNPVVVELFTSQGCSSCPPADKLMHELAEREDVLPLALHVDYWDYIGWKDPFGSPAHADRQRAYAAAGKRRSIYTPEMIVAGVTDIIGARPMDLSKAIAEHARQPALVTLSLERVGDKLTISAEKLAELGGPVTVYMLRYTPRHKTEIQRGENQGRTLEYANIVEDWTTLDTWDGAAPLELSVAVTGDKPVAVILQRDKVGPILAAARIH